MSVRIVTYVGDEPVEETCAICNVTLPVDTEFCINGCDGKTQ